MPRNFRMPAGKGKKIKEAVVNTAPRAAEERGVGLESASG